jgi:ABC-type hemin transport system substrate-binding protein
LNLLAWNYPYGKGLKNLIEQYKIYPITILQNLTKQHVKFLLEKEIVTCNQLATNISALDELQLTKRRIKRLEAELKEVV